MKNEILWITMINHGYISFTKNFLESMKRANVSFTLIIYCTDFESIKELEPYNNCSCVHFPIHKISHLATWGQNEYKKVVFAKLDAILTCMKENPSKNIGFIDTDIILFSDPTPVLQKKMREYPSIDIFSQCDEVGTKCSNNLQCVHLCSGVIVFRNKSYFYNILSYDPSIVKHFTGDQAYLKYMFTKRNIPYVTIDKSIFPNGAYFSELKKTKISIPSDCVLLHFNYMIGLEKQRAMQLQDMWYI
jgi:hypothetical protein